MQPYSTDQVNVLEVSGSLDPCGRPRRAASPGDDETVHAGWATQSEEHSLELGSPRVQQRAHEEAETAVNEASKLELGGAAGASDELSIEDPAYPPADRPERRLTIVDGDIARRGERGLHVDVAARPGLNPQTDLALSWTAHELRGPLLGIRAAMDAALMALDDGNGAYFLLMRSRQEVDYLADLVEGILDWGVHDGGLQRKRTDLVQVVRAAVDSCELEEGAPRVSVEGPANLDVPADSTQLQSAISNVVRNALWYSPANSRVWIAIARRAHWAEVSVTNNGPGIDLDYWETLFDPFTRGNHPSSGPRGRGLGLFIAQRVVRAHQGNITIESSEGETTFRITLPREERGGHHQSSGSRRP
jgi:signal transduction histidine kinase